MNFGVIPASYSPVLLSVFRIVAGLLFLEHGTGKLLGFPAHLPYVDQMPGGMLWTTGLLELVGGALITIGLLTRPAAFVLSGFMAFAYFIGHFPHGFFPALTGGEPAILFCFAFLYFAAVGAGPISVDAALGASEAGRSSASRDAAAA